MAALGSESRCPDFQSSMSKPSPPPLAEMPAKPTQKISQGNDVLRRGSEGYLTRWFGIVENQSPSK
jgi:hypothetical protein